MADQPELEYRCYFCKKVLVGEAEARQHFDTNTPDRTETRTDAEYREMTQLWFKARDNWDDLRKILKGYSVKYVMSQTEVKKVLDAMEEIENRRNSGYSGVGT